MTSTTQHGILVHRYGPHIFHTNSREIADYLSRFTALAPLRAPGAGPGRRQAGADPDQPHHASTASTASISTSAEVEAFLAARAEPVPAIRTSEDVVVGRVGRELYEKFFRGYTRKQWGLDPSELDKSVTARVPTRTNTDDRYFTDSFQTMPRHGYTRMFENMLDHDNIKIMLNTDYREIVGRGRLRPADLHRAGRRVSSTTASASCPTARSSSSHETLNQERLQPVAVVNYPDERRALHPGHRVQAPDRPAARQDQRHLRVPGRRRRPLLSGAAAGERRALPQVPGAGRSHARTSTSWAGSPPTATTTWTRWSGRRWPSTHAARRGSERTAAVRHGRSLPRPQVPICRPWQVRPSSRHAGEERGVHRPGLFDSFLLAGFECSTQRRRDGRRLDLLAATQHDRWTGQDYRRVAGLGLRTVRDGLRWHLIETAPGRYDWSSFLPMLRAARAAGVQVIWDLCHYGCPHELDFWEPEFVDRFAHFARAAARARPRRDRRRPLRLPGQRDLVLGLGRRRGEVPSVWHPAAAATSSASWSVRPLPASRPCARSIPRARFIQADPLIHVVGGELGEIQFEAWDMLCGPSRARARRPARLSRRHRRQLLLRESVAASGGTIPLGHHQYKPLADLLAGCMHAMAGRCCWPRPVRRAALAPLGCPMSPARSRHGAAAGTPIEASASTRCTTILAGTMTATARSDLFSDRRRHEAAPLRRAASPADALATAHRACSPRHWRRDGCGRCLRHRARGYRRGLRPEFPTLCHGLRRAPFPPARLAVRVRLRVIVTAASCAVAVQYGMKLLVDAMAPGAAQSPPPSGRPSSLYRPDGRRVRLWRVSRLERRPDHIAAAVDLRLRPLPSSIRPRDALFRGPSGRRPGRPDHPAGTAFSQLMTAFTWHILPPSTDFVGALVVFLSSTGGWRWPCAFRGSRGGGPRFGRRPRPPGPSWLCRPGGCGRRRARGRALQHLGREGVLRPPSERQRLAGRVRGEAVPSAQLALP